MEARPPGVLADRLFFGKSAPLRILRSPPHPVKPASQAGSPPVLALPPLPTAPAPRFWHKRPPLPPPLHAPPLGALGGLGTGENAIPRHTPRFASPKPWRLSGAPQNPWMWGLGVLLSGGGLWGMWARRIVFEMGLSLKLDVPQHLLHLPSWRSYGRLSRMILKLLLFAEGQLRCAFVPRAALNLARWCPPVFVYLAQHTVNTYFSLLRVYFTREFTGEFTREFTREFTK